MLSFLDAVALSQHPFLIDCLCSQKYRSVAAKPYARTKSHAELSLVPTRSPQIFPNLRETGLETGFDRECASSNPLTPANQCGLYVCLAWRRVGGLWTPEFLNPSTIMPKVSRGIRRYSQIFGDLGRRLVRSSTVWAGGSVSQR